MRTAFIHDWLNGMRGGERCLEALCELYPDADIYTLFYERGKISPTVESHAIHPSFIQKLPWKFTKYRHYLPLFPVAIEQFDLRGYDLVISLSHCVANGVITTPAACHIGYTFTPMRYAWDLYQDYFGGNRLRGLSRFLIPFFMNYLRIWDVAASKRVEHFVAISQHVKRRIAKHYRRDADVIYPPVNTDFYTPDSDTRREDFFLIVSAFAPYKKIELAIEACHQLGVPLKIIGQGQEAKELTTFASPFVEFLGARTDEDVRDYYRRCRALLFPGEEDFGIAPLEAQACGTPVIAYAKGGALETVISQKTGLFFPDQSPESIIGVMKAFENHPFIEADIRAHACRFAKTRFQHEMKTYIEEKMLNYMDCT